MLKMKQLKSDGDDEVGDIILKGTAREILLGWFWAETWKMIGDRWCGYHMIYTWQSLHKLWWYQQLEFVCLLRTGVNTWFPLIGETILFLLLPVNVLACTCSHLHLQALQLVLYKYILYIEVLIWTSILWLLPSHLFLYLQMQPVWLVL